MRYYIVNTKDNKEVYAISNPMFEVFGSVGVIPNDAVKVSFWKYVWFRVVNGI